jgi:hypothetical protein
MNDADTPTATELLAEQNKPMFVRLSIAEQKNQFQRGYLAGQESNKWLFSATADLMAHRTWALSQANIEHDYSDINELMAMSMELIEIAEHSGKYEWIQVAYITRRKIVSFIRNSDYLCSGFYDALDCSIYAQWKEYENRYGSNPEKRTLLTLSAQQWAATQDNLTISPSLYLAAKSLNHDLFDPTKYPHTEVCDDYNESGDCWFCSE